MGEIPVLEEDGERLTQTAPILLKLAEQYGRFGGETEQEKFEVLRWLFWDNHKLTGYMATYRYHADVHAVAGSAGAEAFPQAARRFPRQFSKQHLQTNAFAIGDRPTIADISMMAYLHYPGDETGYDLAASHPADERLARPHRRAARLAIGLRSVARQAPDALRLKR